MLMGQKNCYSLHLTTKNGKDFDEFILLFFKKKRKEKDWVFFVIFFSCCYFIELFTKRMVGVLSYSLRVIFTMADKNQKVEFMSNCIRL